MTSFEGRASLRSWLYRIATNRCLNALRDSARRPRETLGLVAFEPPEPTRMGEPLWLQPYPDALLEDAAAGPEARYETKEAVTLAFVSGLQRLPPRQRAVLVLRDVLGFSASETAAMVDGTEASANSALQRARATLEARTPADRERAPLPRSAAERDLVGRFAEAFERNDIDAVVALLTDDAVLSMPPEPLEYEGPEAVARFFTNRVHARGGKGFRLVPTRANGQPAFAYYMQDPQAARIARFNGIVVLTLEGDRIAGITRFGDSSVLPAFGLPRTIPWDS